MNSGKFYITTAIDYPNGSPHLGHAYEKIVTDAYARWYRLLGNDVFYLTGTDENGQKLVQSAEAVGQSTQSFVDQHVGTFKELCKKLNITHQDFIRTTEPRHHETTQQLWKKMEEAGDIYFSEYEGKYCLSCEAFYTELQAPQGVCPEHHKPLDTVTEKGYFLKTSQYQNWIIEYIKTHPTFVAPELSRKEILSRLESEPMRDLSITRPNKGWGIPVPGKPEYVIYTWFDALINYYTATLHAGLDSLSPKPTWPASCHVVGRDILWFHSVIWPIMLKSAKLPLPSQVYVHGMVLAADGKKMSKSLGNGVDPFEVVQNFPLDSFRYYLLRAIPANGNGAFVIDDLKKRHQSELGNDFGNLLMRVVKLARKRTGDHLPKTTLQAHECAFQFKHYIDEVTQLMEAREHHRALERIWAEVNAVNGYINEQAPWGIKEDEEKFKKVIYNGLYGIDVVSQTLLPFIPESASKALQSLGLTYSSGIETKTLDLEFKDYTLSDPPVLFPRME